jgi:hypothetical protein
MNLFTINSALPKYVCNIWSPLQVSMSSKKRVFNFCEQVKVEFSLKLINLEDITVV